MRGLRTQEGNEFEKFFQLVQNEADKQGAVFFLECGEGNDFNADGIEGEDLRGWLIPEGQADKFERDWANGEPGDEWEDNIAWAQWSGKPEAPVITINQY